MKKIIFSLLIGIFFITSIFLNLASAEFKKTKIAVLDFQLQGERYETADMGKIVAEWLITALVKEGRFDVIERRLLEKVVEEQKIGVSGIVDESSASKLGKVLGAKIVITGSVMKFQNVMEVNARIIEVESSSIIAAENVKSTSAVKLEDLVVQMAEKIIKDFPLEGYIVQRDENKALIDLGKRAGVKTGMQFIVFKEGKVIKHPKTGEVLDVERIETGSIEIKDVKDKIAEGVILKETSPNAIKTGQLVKSTVELVPPEIIKPEKPERIAPETEKIPDADLLSRLHALDLQSEEVKQMRESGSREWKDKYKEVIRALKILRSRYKKSPEVYLSFAKAFYAVDKTSDGEEYLDKACSFRPPYLDAFLYKGDVNYDAAMKLPHGKRNRGGFYKNAVHGYQTVAKLSQDKDVQAAMYLKIGNIYAELADDRDKAKEYWHKAVSTSPGSRSAKLANERLRGY